MSSSERSYISRPQLEEFRRSSSVVAKNSGPSSGYTSSTHSQELDNEATQSGERQSDFPTSDLDPITGEQKDYTRANRFYGPASTWRSWTEEDRIIVSALERERAQDLGVHLYNAYALRCRARASRNDRTIRGRSQDQITRSVDRLQKVFPSSSWTAWPLPPAEVPRESFRPSLGGVQIVRAPVQDDSRTSLTEALIAEMTRIARERFRAREWEPVDPTTVSSLVRGEGDDDVDMKMKNKKFETEASEIRADIQSAPMSSLRTLKKGEVESDRHSDESADMKFKEGLNTHISISERPGPTADDAKTRQILQPSAHHILEKLDKLLMALHKARLAYAEPTQPGRRRGGSCNSAVEASLNDSSESEDEGEHRGRKRKRRVSTAGSVSSTMSHVSVTGKSRKARQLLPRNWSDVLGMAALVGWDDRVIKHASSRCADLLEENMMFRTFHEGVEDEPAHFTEHFATGEEPDGNSVDETDKESSHANEDLASIARYAQLPHRPAGDKPEFSCSMKGCKKAGTDFSSLHKLRRHIRRVHPEANVKNTMTSRQNRQARSQSRPLDRAKSPLPSRYCPVESCRRHVQPFRDSRDMYRHVESVHPKVNLSVLKHRFEGRINIPKSSKIIDNEAESDRKR